MPTLADLLPRLEGARLCSGDPSVPVAGVSHDTRRLRPGELFVAVPGFRLNGLELVPEAVVRGASAIVAEAPPAAPVELPLVLVPSARAALADLAAAFHGDPSHTIPVIGVTGTDGKTSTVQLLSAILEAHGLRTGWLTTINTRIGGELLPNAADHTTPEAPLIQEALARMVERGVRVAILETSSHALALDRVRGIAFRVGVFTNLSPEHINFHGSFEAYRAAKARLFAALPPDGLAVLNADDPHSEAMRVATRARVLSFGLEREADLRASDIRLTPEGTTFTLHWRRPQAPAGSRLAQAAGCQTTAVTTRLVGRFNVANWLAAFGAATSFGATVADLQRAAERQEPVPGRMNLVRQGQPFAVVVDFAHTPQALEQALATVRSLASGRVLLVFGLAGGRDRANRPVMGALAARKSDFFVASMDDPGDEDPREIARQIADGARAAGAVEGERFVVDLDRRSAIRTVLRRARPGDAVLLAGKGHETRMVVGGQRLSWNDATVTAEELRALAG